MKRPSNAFDWFVLAGAAVNVMIIGVLFIYWVVH